jgi:tryptophan synthase alpha chain
MNKIDKTFKRLRGSKNKALIIYITGGYPNLNATKKLIQTLEKSGADLIEIGIPFSDPLADGPTIQRSSTNAISKGANIKSIINTVRSLKGKINIPLLFMTYFNPVLYYGLDRFIKDSTKAGIDGVIIPDLPPEESESIIKLSKKNKFSTVFLIAPTSTNDRIKLVSKRSTGFIYYVSLTGVTGARKHLPKDIKEHIKKIKKFTDKPVCIGFGVSNREQAAKMSRIADGVIVGSAVIRIIENNIGNERYLKKVSKFTRSLKEAINEK